MNRRFFAELLIVMTLLSIASGNIAAQQSRFHSSQETGGAPGRYRVELELRPGDDLVSVSGQLAATYGARIEPYAEEGFLGFAILATPTRARLMSTDPRVVAITDLTPLRQPAESVSTVQPRTPSPVAEQVRTVLTSEAVPGLGNYSYDGSGNVTSIDNHVFRYDAFGRLQNAVLGSFGSQAYTYDRYGNIMKIVTDGDDANAARMSVDPETNQMDLPFSASNPANMIATYDGVGNIITYNGSFVYDALNVMKETTDTTRRLHVYSASNERVMVVQVANGVETTSEWTLRDGSNRVLRRLTKDSAGVWQWKGDYIYGGSSLLAAEVPGSERVRHFHPDHLGTPRLITGNGGVRIAEKTYAPFGRKMSPVTDDFEQLEFTGHERDTPSLDYMHARYYQTDLGRFLSVDPGGYTPSRPQSWNRYAYVENNPIKALDPDGRETQLVVGYQTNSNPVGHIALAINGRVYSYGTEYLSRTGKKDWGVSLATYLGLQNGRRETALITLNISPQQEQDLQQHLEANNPNAPGAPKYNELANSCVTVTDNALMQTGIIPPPQAQNAQVADLNPPGTTYSATPQGVVQNVGNAGLIGTTTTVGEPADPGFLSTLLDKLFSWF